MMLATYSVVFVFSSARLFLQLFLTISASSKNNKNFNMKKQLLFGLLMIVALATIASVTDARRYEKGLVTGYILASSQNPGFGGGLGGGFGNNNINPILFLELIRR
jgi:hypothetical protein